MKKYINERLIIILSITLLIGTSSIIAKPSSIDSELIQETITTGSAITLKEDEPPVEREKEVLKEDTRTSSEASETFQKEPVQQVITTESAIQINTVVFSNRVYNTETNEGIEGVKVIAFNDGCEVVYETTTDRNGYFTLEVMPGEYFLEFRKSGFKTTKQLINIVE